ncbi:MAG: HU family DNA-binding protein [Roseitalea sp.]|jgi:DNA-binding protein HU-beta|uniref:HU family DNA-binding protein n=1 Tax=Oceaniradius stylonematis TaxID=2184161 RepID=A0A3A8A7P0_9HYPH|nr:HU family DNA-binding protein [Oceaniradius stylonematis]MBO6553039.1 HU family DNA-binding protein [Roseitalea sp.]MBO6951201.1 HU family DNA-binding protein [Rhizobiaceae bacterium]RNC93782.1 MAG: HU family DNA-binding protein [Oricola sp.]MBO6590812.1 HU family DNA-binding protein [Roseitalea sp.]MBO6599930.1 HU family DNA-binding protein [Roseitalea sp.]
MNKNELAAAVADKAGLAKGDAASAVDAVFATITETLSSGGDVRVLGFGNFVVQQRAATTGRNPMTGAAVDIPAKRVPKFSAGKALKEAVNS